MKVLLHIDEASKWRMVLENAKNMLKYGKENETAFEIEIAANGPAVTGLLEHEAKDSGWYSEMEELHKEKVVFAACNNALQKFNSYNLPICTFVSVVPAGMVEIAMKQQEGFSYIKP